MMRLLFVGITSAMLLSGAALAKDSLGVFESWGAFRDLATPRCYAIAEPVAVSGSRVFQPYASVGTWPRQRVRGQMHFRLSRNMAPGRAVELSLGERRFVLTGGGADAWAADKRDDAAIVAAMRSASSMTVRATDRAGRAIRERYTLAGAATAVDAAALGCARLGR